MDATPTPTPNSLSNIRFVPHITPFNRSLHFEVMEREVPDSLILKVGRYTDKVPPTPNRIAFKSKVVSRTHAEIWAQSGQVNKLTISILSSSFRVLTKILHSFT
jgi:hypothetical protein